MKKPYRNALRSKQMIGSAFIDLLREKPLEQVTVVDIVNRCGLCRNTFYAHYQDVYAVLEEYQQKGIEMMRSLFDEAVENRQFDDPLPLLLKIAAHLEENKEIYRVLLSAGQQEAYTLKVKNMLIERIMKNIDTVGIRDKQGFFVFMEVLMTGFIHLFQLYLKGQTPLSPGDIARETNRIFCAGVSIYRM